MRSTILKYARPVFVSAVLTGMSSSVFAALLGTPVTAQNSYSGGDATDGLALTGTYLQTVDVGNTSGTPVSLQGYTFSPLTTTSGPTGDTVVGVDFQWPSIGVNFNYGASADDQALANLMGSSDYGNTTTFTGYSRNIYMTMPTTPGATYQLQLLVPNDGGLNMQFELFLEGASMGTFNTTGDTTGGTVITSTFTIADPSALTTGATDGSDLDINVFQTSASSNLVTVGAATLKQIGVTPEPASLSLLGIAGLGLLRRRARA